MFLSFQRLQSQHLSIVMGIVRDYAHHVPMVVKVHVKDVKGVVKTDVKVDVQVAVHNHVVVGAVVFAKGVV